MADAQRYVDIKALLDVAHPVSGVWNVDDALATDQMNLKDIAGGVETLSGTALQDATDPTEFAALAVVDQQLWVSVCGWGSVDTGKGLAKSIAARIFAATAGTITRPALVALTVASLAEVNSLGTIRLGDIQAARAII